MLDVKKWMLKVMSAISSINSKLTVTTLSISITATTGTLVRADAKRYGNIVQVNLVFRNSASVASGSNLFVGTINTVALRPAVAITSGSYYGNHAVNVAVGSGGGITVRNASSTAISMGSNQGNVAFTYIVGGGSA